MRHTWQNFLCFNSKRKEKILASSILALALWSLLNLFLHSVIPRNECNLSERFSQNRVESYQNCSIEFCISFSVGSCLYPLLCLKSFYLPILKHLNIFQLQNTDVNLNDFQDIFQFQNEGRVRSSLYEAGI